MEFDIVRTVLLAYAGVVSILLGVYVGPIASTIGAILLLTDMGFVLYTTRDIWSIFRKLPRLRNAQTSRLDLHLHGRFKCRGK